MKTTRYVGVIGSREFKNRAQMYKFLDDYLKYDDVIVSGGAKDGGDVFALAYARENGYSILVHFPDKKRYGQGAVWVRNTKIAESSDVVLAFYSKDRFQIGGTHDTVEKAKKLNKQYIEFREHYE